MAALCVALTACIKKSESRYRDVGDFYVYYDSWNNMETYIIDGISKSAADKQELVIPTKLENKSVQKLGLGLNASDRFSSEKLRKIFWSGNQNLGKKRIVADCLELDTIVFTSVNFYDYQQFFTKKYIDFFKPSYHQPLRNMRFIVADNIQSKLLSIDDSEFSLYLSSYKIELPNVNYYYNYSSSPNLGYAWIDYLEEGEQIITLPPTPEREGYEFTGWYSDEECNNKADLNSFVKTDTDAKFYAGWKEIQS